MRITFLLSSFLLAGFSLRATPPLTTPPPAPPLEDSVQVIGDSIDVRVVNVEAVVTDKAGKRVHGLKANDLRLLVDGKEVPVEFFNEVEDGRTAAPGAANGDPVPRNYLVYLDDSFSIATRRDPVLDKLERDLSLLHPTDRMAILAFDGTRIDVLSDWTADLEQLKAALARARRRPAHGNRALVSKRALPRDVSWIRTVFGGTGSGRIADDEGASDAVDPSGQMSFSGSEDQRDQVAAIYDQLSHRIPLEARTQLGRTAPAIAAALGGFAAPPGRKVLLYLTGAWTLGVAPELYAPLITIANQAGYSLYPVDMGNSGMVEISYLDDLAKTTGGRALVSPTDEVFRLAVSDSGSYYWLGFSPTWKGDDQGHRIAVEALRPGLQVRARFGFSDPSRGTQVALQAGSLLLFGGAKEDQRLIVQLGAEDTARTKPSRRAPKTIKVPLTLGVPVESLLLTPQGTGYVAELPLAIKAEDAKLRQSDLPALRLRVLLPERPKGGTFARFRTVLELRNVAQRLVFTVQDPFSGRPVWGQASMQPRTPSPVGQAGREW